VIANGKSEIEQQFGAREGEIQPETIKHKQKYINLANTSENKNDLAYIIKNAKEISQILAKTIIILNSFSHGSNFL
jgi:hypothetical protein